MKTVEKAHCSVNQEKIGGCNSQKVETLQRGDDKSNDHKSAVETRKTLPPSTRVQAAGVKATRVSAEKEPEDARKKEKWPDGV